MDYVVCFRGDKAQEAVEAEICGYANRE